MEEALARLLRDAGYRLVTDPSDDRDGLIKRGAGLAVRGRGANHQADVLGLLATPVPFGLRLRLFLEAKHRGTKTGLADIRSAYAVMSDLNQFVPSTGRRRFDHQYAFFSVGGYTDDAQRFADAHGISLQDFTGTAWELLRTSVETTADDLKAILDAAGSAVPLAWARQLLRVALGTETSPGTTMVPRPPLMDNQRVLAAAQPRLAKGQVSVQQVEDLIAAFSTLVDQQDRSLLIAHHDGQMMLVLRPDSSTDLAVVEHLASQHPHGEVAVRFGFDPAHRDAADDATADGQSEADPGDWCFYPEDERDGPRSFRLRVGIPLGFEAHLLTTDGGATGGQGRLGVVVNGRSVVLVYNLAHPQETSEEPWAGTLRTRPDLRTPVVAIPETARRPEVPVVQQGTDSATFFARQAAPDVARPGGRDVSDVVPQREPQTEATGPAGSPAPPSQATGQLRRSVDQAGADLPGTDEEELLEDIDQTDLQWEPHEVKHVLYALEERARRLPSARQALTVMRAAAVDVDGYLWRTQVAEVTGAPAGAKFNGHTGAVSRVVRELEAELAIREDLPRPLVTRYGQRLLTGRRAVRVELCKEFRSALLQVAQPAASKE